MKREILFRGKRVDGNNNWAYGSLITDGKMCFIIRHENLKIGYNNTISNTSVQQVDPETVGQFTGMYDKSKVKIFEGDECLHSYKGFDVNVIVKFRDGCFFLCAENDNENPMNKEAVDFHQATYAYFEKELDPFCHLGVIGNIHDK